MSDNPMFAAFFEGFRPARRRERAAHTIYRALEARNEATMQDVGGGSPAPAPRTPRRSPATAKAKKSDGCDGDSDPEPERREHSHRTERLLRLPQVLDMVGLGKTMVYQMMKTSEFPQPRKIRHLSVWVESEVQSWIEEIAKPNPVEQKPGINPGIVRVR